MPYPESIESPELRLASELNKLGVEVISNFVLPGSHFEIDLYLPQLPRAAIGIKRIDTLAQFDRGASQLKRIMAMGKAELGDTFIPIYVALISDAAPLDFLPALAEGIELVTVKVDIDGNSDMAIAAATINQLLKDRRSWLSLPAMAAVIGAATGFPGAILGSIGGILAIPWLISEFKSKTGRGKKTPQPSQGTTNLVPYDGQAVNSGRASPPSEQQIQAITNQASCILLTFRELSSGESLTAEHELNCLIEEFRLGHYTACALRAGRCLESMVFLLSRKWGIDLVAVRLGDMADTDPTSRKKAENKLDEALHELNSKATQAMLAIKNAVNSTPEGKPATGGPRPPVALLKRVRSRYGYLGDVSKSISELIGPPKGLKRKSAIERIMEIRNRAAHVQVDGGPCEIEEDLILQMMDDINFVMLKLSNVGIAIHRHRSQADKPAR